MLKLLTSVGIAAVMGLMGLGSYQAKHKTTSNPSLEYKRGIEDAQKLMGYRERKEAEEKKRLEVIKNKNLLATLKNRNKELKEENKKLKSTYKNLNKKIKDLDSTIKKLEG